MKAVIGASQADNTYKEWPSRGVLANKGRVVERLGTQSEQRTLRCRHRNPCLDLVLDGALSQVVLSHWQSARQQLNRRNSSRSHIR